MAVALPDWARGLSGGHDPDPNTWRCTRCPHQPSWPCPFARDFLATHAVTSPYTGLLWLSWCYNHARADLGDRRGVLRARMVGWYEVLLGRVHALTENRGRRWPRWGVTGRYRPR